MKRLKFDAIVRIALTKEGAYYYKTRWANKSYTYIDQQLTSPYAYNTTAVDQLKYSQKIHHMPQIGYDDMVDLPFRDFVRIFAKEGEFEILHDRTRNKLIHDWVILHENDLVDVDGGGNKPGVQFDLSPKEAELLVDTLVAFEDETGEDASGIREIVEDAIEDYYKG